MAWGPDANTEEELEKLAAARAYFAEEFPGTTIRNSYDAARLAQIFRIETGAGGEFRDAVLSTEFLDDHPASKIGKVLAGWRVAEQLRAATGTGIVVTTWGVEEGKG